MAIVSGKRRLAILLVIFLALAVSSVCAEQSVPASANLVGEWLLHKGFGNVANDSSGNNNDGTINGASWLRSYDQYALSLDGSNDYVDLGSAAMLTPSGAITISAWVRPSATQNQFSGIVGNENGNNGYILRYGGSNLLTTRVGSGTAYQDFGSAGSTPTNRWTHVIFVFTGSQGIYYLNGVAESPITATISSIAYSAQNVRIGTDTLVASRYFNGRIDEVRVYNRTLTATEVTNLYQDGLKRHSGVVASWDFNEGTGAIARDSSGFGNDGVLTSGPTWVKEGKLGSALGFDGASKYASVGDQASLDIGTGSLTVEFWAKSSYFQTSSAYIPISKGAPNAGCSGTGNMGYEVRQFSTYYTFMICYYSGAGTSGTATSPSFTTTNGVWHHIASVFNRDAQTMVMYIDGVAGSTANTAFSNYNIDSTGSMCIGSRCGSHPFNGTVDSVKIYDRALTAEEIKANYNGGAARLSQETYEPNGLVGYWKLDEGTGTTAADSSGSGNTGTVTGATWTTSGKYDAALSFGGSGNFVNMSNTLSMGSGSFTLESWVRPTSSSGYRAIVSKGEAGIGSARGYRLRLENDNTILFTVTGDTEVAASTSQTLSSGTWYHIAATKDASNMKIYIDGQLVKTVGSPAGTTDNSFSATIGKQANWYWVGQLDDVRVYNRALDPWEIRQVMDLGRPRPVLDMGFDEDYGQIYDRSGNSNNGIAYGTAINHGTLGSTTGSDTNDPTWATGCKSAGCLSFDGSSDYITIPYTATLAPTSAITAEAWFSTTDKTAASRIFSKTETGGYSLSLNENSACPSSTLCMLVRVGGSYYAASYAVSNLNNNQWYHATGTYDGETVTLYLDGVAVNSNTNPSGAIQYSVSNPLCIGSEAASSDCTGGAYLPGKIDEARFYNRALTAQEVAARYNGIDLRNGLVSEWKFDEGSGQTAYDSEIGRKSGEQCKVGKCMSFDGVNDYVALNNAASLNLGLSDFSLEAWIKLAATPQNGSVLEKRESNSRIYQLTFSGGKLYANYNYDNNYKYTVGNTILQVGQWYHIIAVVNRSVGFPVLYLNGINDGYSVHGNGGSPQTTSMDNTGNLLIGRSTYTGYTGYFNGNIDQVKIFNRALTQREIMQEMNAGRQGPVLDMRFDEGGGTIAYDSSGYSNDGAISGAVWKTEQDCLSGYCLKFDGSDDYVDTGSGTSLDLAAIGTVSLWFKHAKPISGSIPSQMHIMSLGPREFYFSSSTSKLHYFLPDDTTGVGSDSGSWDTNWHHVVVTSDGTTLRMYIDGLSQSSTATATGQNFFYNSGNLRIGRSSTSFNGMIDSVKVFPYVLTPQEIQDEYNQGKSRLGRDTLVSSDGMVGYWKLDENSGTAAADSSGVGNTGTISGATWTASGKYGYALSFDGNDDISLGDPSDGSLDVGTGSFTASFWVKHNSFGDNNYVYEKGYYRSGINGFASKSAVNGVLYFLVSQGTSQDSVGTTSGLVAGSWYHITQVYDKTNLKMGVYVNGLLNNEISIANTASTNIDNSNTFFIGEYGGSSMGINGIIDDFRFFRRALSPKEIEALYRYGPGPILDMDFDIKSGNSVYDRSGNGNTGAVSGSPTWKTGAECKKGRCMSFPDETYVLVPDNAILNLSTSDFTIAGWVNIIQPTNYGSGIFGNYPHSGQKGDLSIGISDNRVSLFLNHRDINNQSFSHTYTFTPYFSKWTHLVWVKEGSRNSRLYLNGVLVQSYTAPYDYTVDFQGGFYISSTGWSPGIMSMKADEVKVFNRALSQEEIMQLFNDGNPVGWWTLDEGSGKYVYDSSVYANTGTALGGPKWVTNQTSCPVGYCMEFDGSDDCIKVTSSTGDELNPLDGLTLEAWVYWKGAGTGSPFIISKGWSDVYELTLSSGKPRLQVVYDYGTSDLASVVSPNAISPNQWQHIAATYDKQKLRLYVNGTQVATADYAKTMKQASIAVKIGSNAQGGEDPNQSYWQMFKGLIDDARIYNYARTAEQIRQDYNKGLARLGKGSVE